jgi:hypothetical protein
MSAAASVARVVIRDATVHKRQFGNREFKNQVGFMETGTGESLRIEVSLPDAMTEGYPPGVYQIGGESFDKDQYGRPAFGKRGLYLVPVPKAA